MCLEKFKNVPNRDNAGICIPKYVNFTANEANAPAKQIISDPSRVSEIFSVQDAEGNLVQLSLEWLLGFFDGEGTITFFINKNDSLTLGYQIQSAFIIVQSEADYLLLTAIANFLGKGTVNVNRKDETSVRYQIRIVDPETLVELIIPLLQISKLRTKKGNEFVIWAECTKFLKEKQSSFTTDPTLAITLLENIKKIKYEGSPTKQALNFIGTCDRAIYLK